jgi:hypothetical protein
VSDLAAFGIPEDSAAQWVGVADEPVTFGVYEECWTAFEVFMAMAGQWRWSGGMESHRTGLDYPALPIVFDLLNIRKKRRPEIFRDLQTMEFSALSTWSEQYKKQHKKP